MAAQTPTRSERRREQERTGKPGMRARDPLAPAWRALDRFGLPLALAVAALVHLPALGTFFAQDDLTALARAAGIEPTPWGYRPLSAVLAVRLQHAAFGLAPLGYHVVNLALHLANVALVHALASRLAAGPRGAAVAALLFGVSGIAFTPVHWMSGIGDLLALALVLAATILHLDARGRIGWTVASAALGCAAALAKESALAWPMALAAIEWRAGERRWKALVPALVATAVAGLVLWAGRAAPVWPTSGAYAVSFDPRHLAINLLTYARWLATVQIPVRDAVAAPGPTAWPLGLAVVAALAFAAWADRRSERRVVQAGLGWMLAFLVPVLPLAHHTYLYYLYLPWAGGAIAIAAAGAAWFERLKRRGLAAAGAVGVAALALAIGADAVAMRARERDRVGTFLRDKVLREAELLENAVRDLRAARVAAGDTIAFVNPAPRRGTAMANLAGLDSADVHRYIPLEGALRQGQAIRLFFPDAAYAGFDATIPAALEGARAFLYQDEGTLRDLGRGAAALAALGEVCVRLRQFERADSLYTRSIALGDTLPDAAFGLIVTRDFTGRPDESRRWAETFVRRWPDDPRAAAARQR